ncbi:hypothetical protein HPB49_009689 [Dermacentor silvarum]|uniref:Uncharacterized protein n=1 Tax=Dermacentor silvarum TaxID=543639 RepID=A0ACB8D4D6_DERSI|nr:hypothetical protein HPB49_009689 [Dermacentor silvarum]
MHRSHMNPDLIKPYSGVLPPASSPAFPSCPVINAAIPPPPFLQCPGMPAILWYDWRRDLQVYIDAAGRDATPALKKALLQCLETQAGADGGTSDAEAADVYEEALAVLSTCFAPEEDKVTTRLQFKRSSCGFPNPHDFSSCGFGATTDIMLRDQILGGLLSNPLRRRFIQMGNDFTFQKAIDVAKKEGCTDILMQQLSVLHVDAVTHRQAPQHSRLNERRLRRDRQDGSLPANPGQGLDGGNWTGLSPKWGGDGRQRYELPPPPLPTEQSSRWQTASAVTHTATILNIEDAVGALSLIRVPVQVSDVVLPFRIDTAAVVSFMHLRDYQQYFAHISLRPRHLVLNNYSEQVVKILGSFRAAAYFQGKSASVHFYVTERGSSLPRLDAIKA